MSIVRVKVEGRRGCGWRVPGARYLVSKAGQMGRQCGRLPIPLVCCPTCGAGIKFARGWTWVQADTIMQDVECDTKGEDPACESCPFSTMGDSKPVGMAGLVWIGKQFYRRPEHWLQEADRIGVSRRISSVPRQFELGKTWVLAAHLEVIKNPDGSWLPGIFHAFQPEAIEYIVKGDETEDDLKKLEERGFDLVKVERNDGLPLFKGSKP